MEHKTETITYNQWRYNQPGESHDGEFTVGDEIVARTYSNGRLMGKITGPVTEILVCERRGIYQLQTKSGWCVHPGRDEVEIVNPYKQ